MLGLNKLNWKNFRSKFRNIMDQSYQYSTIGYHFMRTIGWYIVTTAMITALPLVFEYNREMQVEELERLQVADALEKGANPMQLAQQGMTSAVEPKVLK